MKKLKIGIDIDNVIADSYPQYIREFNKTFATNVKYEEIFDFYYLEKYVGVEETKVVHFIEKILHSEEFQLAIPPYNESKEIIRKWVKSGHQIFYITSRPVTTKVHTLQWLKNHDFLLPNTKLFLRDVEIYPKDANYKKEIVNKYKIQIMIEDSPNIASILTILVILLDRPWNQGKLPKNVTRVKNWQGIDYLVANTFR